MSADAQRQSAGFSEEVSHWCCGSRRKRQDGTARSSEKQEAALAKSRVVIAHDAMLRGTGTTVDSRRMLSPPGSCHAGSFRPR